MPNSRSSMVFSTRPDHARLSVVPPLGPMLAASGSPATYPAPPETRYARSGDVSIAYQVVGDGPIDLVLVSSWITNVEENWSEPSYARLLTRLGAFGRLILFDKRGIGLSDRVAAPPTLEERMDDIRAVMDAAGSARAILVGSTEGGALCALFAASYPERTAALVMYGSYARRIWAKDYPWGTTAAERERQYDAIRRQWGGPVLLEWIAPGKLDDAPFCRWWAGYLRRSASPGAALALTRMNSEIDVRPVLGAIRVPTLVLHRVDDALCPIAGGRDLAARIPGARLAELPGRDHLPFVGDVDAVVDTIEEFVTGVRPSPSRDRVLATVLLAEIVGATEAAARLGAARWRALLAEFRAAVRHELALHRGGEVGTTGVGVLAVFDGPARAIRCAVAIAELGRRLGCGVRSGLHAGEIDLLAEGIGGVALDVVGRVMARAAPGEVLVSSTVKDLVAGSGIGFAELDTRLLRAHGESWRLFRVGGPAVSAAAGPAATAAGADGPRISPREREIAALLAVGLSNREIAAELSISVATAERHVANLFNKLGFHARAQVAAWAVARALPRTRTD